MQNWIKRLLGSKVEKASIQNQIGDEYYAKADYANAEICYRKALTIKSDYFDALINLGLSLDEQNRYQESEACFKDAIRIKPNSALARFNLGVSLKNQHFLTEAEEVLRQAIEIWPSFFQCHNILGEILLSQNRLDEAITYFQESINLSPNYEVAHKNLGDNLLLLGKFDQAKSCFFAAIEIAPEYAEAHYSLGFLYSSTHQLSLSEQSYRQALKLRPNFANAHGNLGFILLGTGRNREVEFHLRKAVEIHPENVEAYCNLGIVYNEEKNFLESEACYLKAISINPNYANAHVSYGVLLMQKGELDRAIECYRIGISLDPNNLIALSNLLMSLSFCSRDTHEKYKLHLQDFAIKVSQLAKPYMNWCTDFVDKTKPKFKIGFVSGDFHSHPVSFFLESVISNLNLEKFELIAYSNHAFEDDVTARLKPFFGEWNLVSGIPDEILARKIRSDGVHILIDLAGHTARNRLPVFAWKPAPIQVSWLGYFASTGVIGMDYVISDLVAIKPEHHDQFSEKIWYLPNTRLCFTEPGNADKIKVSPLPVLDSNFITFGSFQNMTKISDEVLSLWGKVFEELPSAKLRLQNRHMDCQDTKDQLLNRLSSLGIDAGRVELIGSVSRDEYLLSHAKVDMILDTFPYTGGTTTCEALWMGVPTLTLNGCTMISRQGASILTCAGLADWVAEDEDEYVSKAVNFATDLTRLSELRGKLRKQVLQSPLFDAKLFASNFETALINMWFSKNHGSSAQ
jgi:protein O-GlcNAc transferase